MFSTPSQFSLLSPTVLYLDEDDYRRAAIPGEAIPPTGDTSQWEQYLNRLGRLTFIDWLTHNGLSPSLDSQDGWDGASFLNIGEFRLCIITCESCLSEGIDIPIRFIHDPAIAAHFYVFLEVNEELDEVWFRGLIRYDQLLPMIKAEQAITTIPLAGLEPEITRLLHYCQYLEPSSIPLPYTSVQMKQEVTSFSSTLETLRIKLNEWLDDVVTEGWQAWDSLQPQLAYATRGLADGIKQGKLVNLGLEMDGCQLALVLTLKPQADQKSSILVQLLPTGSDRTLPPNLELIMHSKDGVVVQSVTSRRRDNYIQLKTFRGSLGQQFSISIKLGEVCITEDFEI